MNDPELQLDEFGPPVPPPSPGRGIPQIPAEGPMPTSEEILIHMLKAHVASRPNCRLPVWKDVDPDQKDAWNDLLTRTAETMKWALDKLEQSGHTDQATIVRALMIRHNLGAEFVKLSKLK